jgi:hypothetical protein
VFGRKMVLFGCRLPQANREPETRELGIRRNGMLQKIETKTIQPNNLGKAEIQFAAAYKS